MELWLVVGLVCAVVAVVVGQRKGRHPVDSFMFGAVLGPLGVLLVALLDAPKQRS